VSTSGLKIAGIAAAMRQAGRPKAGNTPIILENWAGAPTLFRGAVSQPSIRSRSWARSAMMPWIAPLVDKTRN
jgi:hypothetical protein